MEVRSEAAAPLIEARQISAGYGPLPVLRDVSVAVAPGEVVALLGPNGAGKTTLLSALTDEVRVTSGAVLMGGEPAPRGLHRRARLGLRMVADDRSVFMGLSVRENLQLGQKDITRSLDIFPELGALLRRRVGLLSGGEQQMLSLARALAGPAKLLLVDELSLGLAPLVVERLLLSLRQAADWGTGILLVEQQVRTALAVADRACVLSRGRVVLEGRASDLYDRIEEVEAIYFSDSSGTPDAVRSEQAARQPEATTGPQ